jgi:hypothetical protein
MIQQPAPFIGWSGEKENDLCAQLGDRLEVGDKVFNPITRLQHHDNLSTHGKPPFVLL